MASTNPTVNDTASSASITTFDFASTSGTAPSFDDSASVTTLLPAYPSHATRRNPDSPTASYQTNDLNGPSTEESGEDNDGSRDPGAREKKRSFFKRTGTALSYFSKANESLRDATSKKQWERSLSILQEDVNQKITERTLNEALGEAVSSRTAYQSFMETLDSIIPELDDHLWNEGKFARCDSDPNRLQLVQDLLRLGADPNYRDKTNERWVMSPFQWALYHGGNRKVIKAMIEHGGAVNDRIAPAHSSEGFPPLLSVVRFRPTLRYVEILLTHGADINGQTLQGQGVLHVFARHVQRAKFYKDPRSVRKILGLLRDYGVRIDTLDARGRTAYQEALRKGEFNAKIFTDLMGLPRPTKEDIEEAENFESSIGKKSKWF